MTTSLSIVICAHNPRRDYLQRTLRSLEEQTFPKDEWELLLIDNESKEPLNENCNLSWHPGARIVGESKVGLTSARLRGIEEAQADLILLVDDDNVLHADYLERGVRIAQERRDLGAWGGQQFPVFEEGVEVDTWKRAFWTATLERDVWSNNYDRVATPVGAGLFIWKSVAEEYSRKVESDELRRQLDRAGGGLNSSGDIDMAFTACDMGLGTGRFRTLKLQHLMPLSRLDDSYIEKLCEGFGYSNAVLQSLRGQQPCPKSRIDRLVDAYKALRMPRHQRMQLNARARGRARAVFELSAKDYRT